MSLIKWAKLHSVSIRNTKKTEVCSFIKHFSLRCLLGVYFEQFYKALQRCVVLLSFFSLWLFCGVHHKEPPLSR